MKSFIKRLAVRLPWGMRKSLAFVGLYGPMSLLLSRPSFTGLYRSFADAPPSRQQDAQYAVDAAERNLGTIKLDEATGLPVLRNSHSLLPFAVSMLANEKPLRVLDIGGAAGVDFANLLKAVSIRTNIQYLVVDMPEVCALGRRRWGNDKRISFSETMPNDVDRFDLIYSSWALQYFSEPLALLEKCASYGANAILLINVPFTVKDAFVRIQANKMIPSWVLSLPDIERAMLNRGYRLSFHVAADGDHNVDNYPPEYRVASLSNLLFVKV